jgi:hypothetical protein
LHEKGFALLDVWPVTFDMRTKMPVGVHTKWPALYCCPAVTKTEICRQILVELPSTIQSTRPERYSHWTNGCVNSCVNSPEDGPVGPKHVDSRRYMNKIEIVTYVGFSFHMLKGCMVQKA